MDDLVVKPELLAQLCSRTDASLGPENLQNQIQSLLPELGFDWALTRGHWHRLGGVVDADYHPVDDNIARWAERESAGDVDELIARYADRGYFATCLAGKTHYFTAACGSKAEDFIQLEIEELQEVLDRPLLARDWYPENLEELLDPLDYPRLEPEPIGKPHYQFRRLTPIAELLDESPQNQALVNLWRFFEDWDRSSACESEPFCRHWILAQREFMNSDGDCRRIARPVSTFAEELPELPPGESLHGAKLANAIHGYDRHLGYPFAWYFIMLSSKAANYGLAEAVLRDQMGAYDYLPARDLKVLRDWEERPYGV